MRPSTPEISTSKRMSLRPLFHIAASEVKPGKTASSSTTAWPTHPGFPHLQISDSVVVDAGLMKTTRRFELSGNTDLSVTRTGIPKSRGFSGTACLIVVGSVRRDFMASSNSFQRACGSMSSSSPIKTTDHTGQCWNAAKQPKAINVTRRHVEFTVTGILLAA